MTETELNLKMGKGYEHSTENNLATSEVKIMNRTQKGAWFMLGGTLLLIAFGIYIFAGMFAAGDRLTGTGWIRFGTSPLALFLIAGVFFIRRKQSPAEPDSDERDNYIKKNAVIACFVSVWVSLFLLNIIPIYIVGETGSISVSTLPIINTGIVFIAMLVYSLAILFQYGREAKGEKS
jgi:hypothetical protein